jgi:Stress responsive A/B Barrel Domain
MTSTHPVRRLALLLALGASAGCASRPPTAFDSVGGEPSSTIRHVVLIDLKSADDAPSLIAAMDSGIAKIPGIVHYWRGEPFPSQRPEVSSNYDVGLVIDFRDAAAYDAYVSDPRHVGLVTEWKPRLNGLTVYDIEPQAKRR